MNEIVKLPVIKDEKYMALLEEIEAAKQETQFNVAMTLLNGNHIIGRAMVEFVEYGEVRATPLVKEVAKDMKYSERNMWDIYRIAKDYPTMEGLMAAMEPHGYSGKNISWTACRRHLLGSGEKTDVEVDLGKVARGIVKRYGQEDAKTIVVEVVNYLAELKQQARADIAL